MEQKKIKIIYNDEEREIPEPTTFIELKYYFCQSFQNLFKFENYKIFFGKNEDITEDKFTDQIKKIKNSEEPNIYMFLKEDIEEEEPSSVSNSNSFQINENKKYEKIKNELNEIYQKEFDKYKKKFNDELDQKLNQILEDILKNINPN